MLNSKAHQRNVFSLRVMVGFVFMPALLASESKNDMWLVLPPGPVQAGFRRPICRFVLNSEPRLSAQLFCQTVLLPSAFSGFSPQQQLRLWPLNTTCHIIFTRWLSCWPHMSSNIMLRRALFSQTLKLGYTYMTN